MSSDYPELEHPIMGPFLQALKIRKFLDDAAWEKEQRQMERSTYAENLQQRQQARQEHDFATGMMLHGLGALAVQPGDEQVSAGLDQTVGPVEPGTERDKVSVPLSTGSKDYRLPSKADQALQAYRQQQLAGHAEYDKAYQTARGKEEGEAAGGGGGELMNFPAIGDQPAQSIRIPKEHYATALKAIQDMRNNKYSATSFSDDGQGNRTFVGINSQTHQPETIPLGPIGKPTVQSEASTTARAKLTAKNRVKQEYSGEHISQMTSDYANGLYQTYAQEQGIDWQTEQNAKSGDPEALRQVNGARAKAQTEARRIVDDNLQKLEAQYTDEELAKGGVVRNATTKPSAVTLDPKVYEEGYKKNFFKMTPAERTKFEATFNGLFHRAPARPAEVKP